MAEDQPGVGNGLKKTAWKLMSYGLERLLINRAAWWSGRQEEWPSKTADNQNGQKD